MKRQIKNILRDGTGREVTLATLTRDDVTGAISAVWHPGYREEIERTRPEVWPRPGKRVIVDSAALLFRYAVNLYTGSSVIAVVDTPREHKRRHQGRPGIHDPDRGPVTFRKS